MGNAHCAGLQGCVSKCKCGDHACTIGCALSNPLALIPAKDLLSCTKSKCWSQTESTVTNVSPPAKQAMQIEAMTTTDAGCKPMTSTDPCFEYCHMGNPQNCNSNICEKAGKIGCNGVQCVLMGKDNTDTSHCMSPMMSEVTLV